MTFHWPPRGESRLASSSRKKRLAALHACIAAVEQTGSAAMARQCFLEAAQEAGFFVRGE